MFKNGALSSMIVTLSVVGVCTCIYTNVLIMISCVFLVCKRRTSKTTAGFSVVFEPNLLLIGRTSYLGVVTGWLLVVEVTKHNEFNDRECCVLA